jgi:hypothetical protein
MDCICFVMDSLNDLRDLLSLNQSIQYFVIDFSDDCLNYWWGMQIVWTAWSGGWRGQTRQAAA